MPPILETKVPGDSGAIFDRCRDERACCSNDVTGIWRILAVAALATACAIVVSVGASADRNPAASVSPGSGAPAASNGSIVEECRGLGYAAGALRLAGRA